MRRFVICLLACCLVLTACQSAPSPTLTPTPTATVQPTSTITYKPTATIQPTLSAADKAITLPSAGFVIIPMDGYETQSLSLYTTGGIFYEGAAEKNTIIILQGKLDYSLKESVTDEKKLNDAVSALLKSFSLDVTLGETYAGKIGDFDAVMANMTGTYQDGNLIGVAFAAFPWDHQLLTGFGFSFTDDNPNQWEEVGKSDLTAQFSALYPMDIQTDTFDCTVATDSTYGFTQDNPIKVGLKEDASPLNLALEGSERASAYLDNLVTEDLQATAYTLIQTITTETTALDEYQIIGTNQKTYTVYIDEFSYSDPKAPVGFACYASQFILPVNAGQQLAFVFVQLPQ